MNDLIERVKARIDGADYRTHAEVSRDDLRALLARLEAAERAHADVLRRVRELDDSYAALPNGTTLNRIAKATAYGVLRAAVPSAFTNDQGGE